MIASLLVVWFLGAQGFPPRATQSACSQALATNRTGATVEICLGEEQTRLANAAPKESTQRSRALESAVQHYRRAVNLASTVESKARALDTLAQAYDGAHLNQLDRMEQVLREHIALQPQNLEPVFGLATIQEDRGLFEAAEETLLAARHQQPNALEPYQKLAQFYARRATAMHQLAESQKPAARTSNPGEPDEHGIYQVGGAIIAPQRLDRAVYPPQALAAGIQGAVLTEIVVDESGDVSEARVLRSIPLLDDEALRSVRAWHFTPTLVNGRPVPVRMTVTVNFTTR